VSLHLVKLCFDELALFNSVFVLSLFVEPKAALHFVLFFLKLFLLAFWLEIDAVVLLLFAFVIVFDQRNYIDKVRMVGVYVSKLDLD
jgi:hypothetical protein